MHVVSPSTGYIFLRRTHRTCSAAGGKLDGPTQAVSFCEHAYLYEHSVIKLNSGSEFPTLIQIHIQIPECTA